MVHIIYAQFSVYQLHLNKIVSLKILFIPPSKKKKLILPPRHDILNENRSMDIQVGSLKHTHTHTHTHTKKLPLPELGGKKKGEQKGTYR